MTEHATGALLEPGTLDGMINQLRQNIDKVDEAIIQLLHARRKYSASVRRIKDRQGKPAVDLARERDIVSAYVADLGKTVGYEVANAVLHFSKSEGPIS